MNCTVCGIETTRVCKQCKLTAYCGVECHNKDWPNHYKECGYIVEYKGDYKTVSDWIHKVRKFRAKGKGATKDDARDITADLPVDAALTNIMNRFEKPMGGISSYETLNWERKTTNELEMEMNLFLKRASEYEDLDRNLSVKEWNALQKRYERALNAATVLLNRVRTRFWKNR